MKPKDPSQLSPGAKDKRRVRAQNLAKGRRSRLAMLSDDEFARTKEFYAALRWNGFEPATRLTIDSPEPATDLSSLLVKVLAGLQGKVVPVEDKDAQRQADDLSAKFRSVGLQRCEVCLSDLELAALREIARLKQIAMFDPEKRFKDASENKIGDLSQLLMLVSRKSPPRRKSTDVLSKDSGDLFSAPTTEGSA